MSRAVFVQNEKYVLYPISEEDREGYGELNRQIIGETLSKKLLTADNSWKMLVESDTRSFSIYNINNRYCGNIELQKPSSNTPEIGIELLEEFRNIGIASCIIPLFLKEIRKQQKVDYFIIKIKESNSHSRYVFEKLGAEFLKKEESYGKRLVKDLYENGKIEKSDKLLKLFENDDDIYVYKMMG